jgi:ABC-type glycerol-3-phosphate transport system substrate-binding protein
MPVQRFARLALAATLALSTVVCRRAPANELVWWTPSWGEARARSLAKTFEAAHPGITVVVQVSVPDGLPTRIQTALRSGSPPDLIEAQQGWIVPYAQADLLLPLDDVVTDRSDYVPAALETSSWNGRLWAAPFRLDAHAILFNATMFRDAGLDPAHPPETWPAFVDAATRLTKTRDGKRQYGFAITAGGEVGNTLFRVLPFIWMSGGDLLSADMKTAIVNQPAAVAGVTFYTDLFLKHHVAQPSALSDDGLANRRLFVSETAAMYQSGPFDIGPIRRENPSLDFGVMAIPHPEGQETTAVLGGWSFIVPKAAKHAAEAKQLIAFLLEPEHMGFFTDTFPARVSAMALPRFADPKLDVYKRMLQHARALPQQQHWLQIVQVFFDQVQRILLKEATPQQAMDAAAKDMQALLDR